MKYCQSCGASIPIEAQICPKCGQWTVPPVSPLEVTSNQGASGSWVQKMGADRLLGLLGFFLMVVSAFLPWLQGYIVGLKFSELSGFQIAGAEFGISLIIQGVIGVVGCLFWKKSSRALGLYEVAIGILTVLDVGWVMSGYANLFTGNPPDVIFDIGSGVYLAIAGSLLVIVAGFMSLVKVRSTRRPVKAFTAQAKPSTGLQGSFPLNEQTVDKQVPEASPGVYALGPKKGTAFYVHFVGRSDTDVRPRLKEYIGKYDRFKFATVDSPEAAFIKECELYHAFRGPEGKIDNKDHPERPQEVTWLCPECSIFRSQTVDRTQQDTATTGKRFCIDCGAELPANVRFCPGCGKETAT